MVEETEWQNADNHTVMLFLLNLNRFENIHNKKFNNHQWKQKLNPVCVHALTVEISPVFNIHAAQTRVPEDEDGQGERPRSDTGVCKVQSTEIST